MPKYPKYTEEEIDFIREYYPTHTAQETLIALNEALGTNITLAGLLHRVKKYRIVGTKNPKFKKGHKPWNKGISVKTERPDVYAKYLERERNEALIEGGKRTWFQAMPVGTERMFKGEWYIKVGLPSEWETKARYVWQQANGKLKKDERILYLNGDKSDWRLENLALVNNKIIARLNRYSLISENADLTKCAVTRAKILQVIKELEAEK